jgi:L-threonylcarbamoyladenylate synthase
VTATDADVARAVEAVQRGDLVVYPTETVYGLGANALDATCVERVFAAKGRDRDDPLSLAAADPEAALRYVRATDEERAFVEAFLPGPVTVVCEKTDEVPDALTGGRSRVGLRVPDHEMARAFLSAAGPVTGTSANVSGRGSVTRVADLDPEIRDAAAVVLDGGETPGAESTVVSVADREILRRGARADDVERWLEERA